MMRSVAHLVLPTALLAGLLGGCSSSAPGTDLEPLAATADRIASLIEQERTCEAIEALHTLEAMADGAPAGETTAVVTRFVQDAQTHLVCNPAPETTEAPPADDDGDDDRDDDKDNGNGNGRGNGRGNGNANGHDDDDDDD